MFNLFSFYSSSTLTLFCFFLCLPPPRRTCTQCPFGASCEGHVVWSGVRAKFGHWRVYDAVGLDTNVMVRQQSFAECPFPPACLGAPSTDDLLRGKFFAPIGMYTALRIGTNETSAAELPTTQKACDDLGSDRFKWDVGKSACLADMTYLDVKETCNMVLGHDVLCKDVEGGEAGEGSEPNATHFCRLCDRCANQHQRESGNSCSKCPPPNENRSFLSLGAILVLLAVAFLVYLQIKNNGQGELSDGVKKILLNWLQISSMASAFPLKWPPAMQGLFVFQSVLSSVGQHLVDPDCELSIYSPADAFYRKNTLYASFPVVAVVLPMLFWFLLSQCRYCSGDRGWKGRQGVAEDDDEDKLAEHANAPKKIFSNKDKAVLSIVVGLYLLFPTTTLQTFSLLSCREVGVGRYWLTADLEEPCWTGRHLVNFFLLVLPQLCVW